MRLRHALTVATLGAWLHGCGWLGSGGADAGAPDAAPGEDAADDAADALSDGSPGEVSTGDDAGADGAGVVDAGVETAVGTLVITADATVQSRAPSGPCAAVDSLSAVPNETTVGRAIALAASGVDPQGQRTDVTLAWTSAGGAGSLTSTGGPSTSFQCTSVGTEQVTVTTSISDGGASCPGIGSLTVALTCDAP